MIGCRMCEIEPFGECPTCRMQNGENEGRAFAKKYSFIGDGFYRETHSSSKVSGAYSRENVGVRFFAYRADSKTSEGYSGVGVDSYSSGVGMRNLVGADKGYTEGGSKYSSVSGGKK